MAVSEAYRWRKTTDINRDHALFDLVDGQSPILDVAFTDEGVLEVAFNPSISGKIIEWGQLLRLLNEGKALAEGSLIGMKYR
jgi:hypothetical protein